MIKIVSLPTSPELFSPAVFPPRQRRLDQTGVGFRGPLCRYSTLPDFCFCAHPDRAAGGEVDVLDPADYGTVIITKAISIVNDGVGTAVIHAASGLNGITINAGENDSVHLPVEGVGSGPNDGIQFNAGGGPRKRKLRHPEFSTAGINTSPSTSSSFSVSNTIASHNSNFGILVQPGGSAAVTGVLSKPMANNNNFGEPSWVARPRPGHRSMSPSSIARFPTT